MAKSEEKTFGYNKDGVIKERHIFVMQEDGDYIAGIDMDLMSDDAKKRIKEVLSDHSITNIGNGGKIENYDNTWNKAWRKFSKSKIVNIKKTNDEDKE